jgi:type I restriction enzyme S subunit
MFDIVELKSVCNIHSGGTPSRLNSLFYNGSIKWAKISDLEKSGDGFIYDTEEYITNEGLKDIRNRIFEVDTLFLAMYGSVGKTAIAKDRMSCNQAILGITVNKTNLIDLKYLKYYFELTKEKLINSARGVALKNLSAGIIKDLEIPLPPLETQKHIAQVLDDAAALRDKTAQLLKEYDKLAQSIFLDMFGDPVKNSKKWQSKKLGSICGVGSSRRVFVDELVDEGIPFYRGKEIGILSENKSIGAELFITGKHYEQLRQETGIPKIGDLLMPSICPDGRIFRVNDEKPFYFKDGRVLWVKVDETKINSYYLRTFLKELFLVNFSKIASGTTFAELKIVELKKVNILCPPIELQNQFAEKMFLIDRQKEIAKQELKESQDLFNCLLQKAFKGELVK